MSSQVQYYHEQRINNGSGNIRNNYRTFLESQQHSSQYEHRSWNQQHDSSGQQNEFMRNEHVDQRPYSQSSTNLNNSDRSRSVGSNRNSYEGSQQHTHHYKETNQSVYDKNNFSHYDRSREQHNYPSSTQQNDNQHMEQQMRNMQINESYKSPGRFHDDEYPQNDRNQPNYNPYDRGPHLVKKSEHFQSNYRQPPQPDTREISYSDSGNTASNQHRSNQPNAYSEPAHLDQIGKPEIIAKTTNDGGEVAVFGLVAKISPPSTLRPQFDHQAPQQTSRQQPPPPQGSPTRSHHLAPISEQPNSPPSSYNRDQNPAYLDDKNRGYQDRNYQNRRPPLLQKPGRGTQSAYDRPGPNDGQRDVYREEHTDSTGYGSTLTERSYDGPAKDTQPQYRQGHRDPQYDSCGPRSPPWQQRSNFPVRNLASDQSKERGPPDSSQNTRNQYYDNTNAPQRDNRSSHWTLRKPNQSSNYEQHNQQHFSKDSGVDINQQIKGVRAVKELFDKSGSNMPLPPKSSSYGPNQYNNTRPVPPRPRLSSKDDWSSRQQQPIHEPRSPTYQRPQQLSPRSHQQPGDFPPPSTTRYQDPSSQFSPPERSNFNEQISFQRRGESNMPRGSYQSQPSQYQDRYPQQNNQRFANNRYNSSNTPPLSHFEPPPQHSQSMGHLDNLEREKFPPGVQAPTSRNSYSNANPHQEEAMVVGVRFEKSPQHPDRGQSRSHPPPPPQQFSSNQDVRPRNDQPDYQPSNVQWYGNNAPGQIYQSQQITRHPYEDERQAYGQPQLNDGRSRGYDYDDRQTNQKYERDHFNQQGGPARSPIDERNYVPAVVAQSYQKFNDGPETNQQINYNPPSQNQQLPRDQDQYGPRDQDRYGPRDQDRYGPRDPYISPSLENRSENQEQHSQQYNQTDNVPNSTGKKFVQFSQDGNQGPRHSADDTLRETPNQYNNSGKHHNYGPTQYSHQEYPNAPTGNQPQIQTQDHSIQQHARQPPTGGDNIHSYPHVPRHPFDPVDEEDSSDGIDVDAPTPPPTFIQPTRQGQSVLHHPMASTQQNRSVPPDGGRDIPQPRPAPTGEKFQQVYRQPGDGLNDDQHPGNLQNHQHQSTVGARPIAPRKPERSSLKKTNKSLLKQADHSSLPDTDEEPHPLNHDHAMERARLAKAGRLSRKPPSRAISSGALVEASVGDSASNCEITVTSDDLVKQRASPITTQQPKVSSNNPKEKSRQSQRNKKSLTEGTQTDVALPAKREAKKDSSKFVFKLPSEEALKRQAENPLPDIQEPAGNDRKKPPTYTALLDQFQSARENALRSAAKKQDRALKSVQAIARMAKRSTSPVKSPTRSPNDKRTKDNHVTYHQSKPKSNRDPGQGQTHSSKYESDETDSDSFDGRGETSRSSRRSRARSKEREVSPRRGGRSKSRERRISPDPRGRSRSPERGGRSRSRDRLRSPERRGRSRSRDRDLSPDRRDRDRSRERHLDRDNRARKSERPRANRPVSPYRHERSDPPYPRSHHRREEPPYHHRKKHSDEPEWVEQYRRGRVGDEPTSRRRAWVNDPRWRQRKEVDSVDHDRDTRRRNDSEQPQRKQMLPSKLMASAHSGYPPGRRAPPGNSDWMRAAQHNRR